MLGTSKQSAISRRAYQHLSLRIRAPVFLAVPAGPEERSRAVAREQAHAALAMTHSPRAPAGSCNRPWNPAGNRRSDRDTRSAQHSSDRSAHRGARHVVPPHPASTNRGDHGPIAANLHCAPAPAPLSSHAARAHLPRARAEIRRFCSAWQTRVRHRQTAAARSRRPGHRARPARRPRELERARCAASHR